jgi:DNA invertase Pin-like site-specific DNA recombinase
LQLAGAFTVIEPDLTKKRVALYARIATDIRTPNSVETQLATCSAYAQRQGWDVVMVLSDKDMSARNEERTGFQALSRAVEQGDVDIVLFVSLNRLSLDLGLVRLFQKTAARLQVELHQIDFGKAHLLDLAILSASDFKKLATSRATRIGGPSKNIVAAPSR